MTAPRIPSPSDAVWGDATWPVPIWKGERPVISDGFKRYAVKDPKTTKQISRQHLGVDVMFKNSRGAQPSIPTRTKWFHCGMDVPMVAMLAGDVWFADYTPMGWTVQVDHGDRYGFPLVSYYTHQSALLVAKGESVVAGQIIGIVGNSPVTENDPNHCHAELWEYTHGTRPRVERCMDPMPYLSAWQPRDLSAASHAAWAVWNAAALAKSAAPRAR